jgi:hypothetical protein
MRLLANTEKEQQSSSTIDSLCSLHRPLSVRTDNSGGGLNGRPGANRDRNCVSTSHSRSLIVCR